MNSSTLQQNYPETYRRFFSRCSLVASSPLMFDWITDNNFYYKGIVIRQKIPLKIYVGLEIVEKTTFSLGDIVTFYPDTKEFQTRPLENELPSFGFLPEFINKLWTEKVNRTECGFIIHCLTELPFGYNLNHRGSFSASLAILLKHILKEIVLDQYATWNGLTPYQLLKSQELNFHETFLLAWKISSSISYGNAWGTGPFFGLVSSPYPLLSFVGEMKHEVHYQQREASELEQLEDIPFWGYDLKDLFPDLSNKPLWPVDISLLFSGREFSNEYEVQKIKLKNEKFINLKPFIKNLFQKDFQKENVFPTFFKAFIDTPKDIEERFSDTHGILSMLLLQQIGELFNRSFEDLQVEYFIYLIRVRHALSIATDPLSPYMTQLLLEVDQLLADKKSVSQHAVFANDELQLGGTVGFVARNGVYKEELEKLEKNLSAKFPDAIIFYRSLQDGFCSDGVIVEQYLDKSIISHHLGKDLVKVVQYTKHGHRDELVSLQDLQKIHETSNVILDLIEKDLTIGNQTVSSKEIHSRAATIQLLTTLLQSPNRQIQNQDLPRSAYSLSKNEMQGKITGPFCRLASQRTGKKLEIVLKGTNTEFSIALKFPDDLNLAVVQKLFG